LLIGSVSSFASMRPKPQGHCATSQIPDAKTPDFCPGRHHAMNPGSDWICRGFQPEIYKMWSRTGALIRTTNRPNQQRVGAAQSGPIAENSH
jgi:hypothetical protein